MAIILPNFFKDFVYNETMINEFFNTPIKFVGVWGSFPFSYYGHDINHNQTRQFALFNDMSGCIKAYSKMEIILLDFSNPYLQEKDYHSRLLKLHFESFADFDNVFFMISKKGLLDYINKNYPNAKVIIDLDYCDFNIDEVENIYGVISWDKEKLLTCADISCKILRKAIYNCHNCHHYKQCLKKDTLSMMDFSEESLFYTCTFKSNAQLNISDFIETDENITYVLLESPKDPSENYYNYLISKFKEENNDKI